MKPMKPQMSQFLNDSLLQVVVFSLKNESYALPISQVREVLSLQEITPLPQAPSFIEGVIHVRGRIFAVIDLRKRFNLGGEETNPNTRIIVVRLSKALVGFIVDTVDEVLSISKAAIQEAPEMAMATHHYFSGITKVENRLILLLNASAIFSGKEENELAEVHAKEEIHG
ncbi:MAG: chemotaxis protein CheW [Chlamydiae bacterium]|nr:chemotaxis protein CheW [Chlamydiota bacterium]MBI3276705.1 chemotaxis protein CheW [Chlamydiota bacterium]